MEYSTKITMSIRIKIEIFKKFKYLCTLAGCSMTERVSWLIENDIKEYQEENKIILGR